MSGSVIAGGVRTPIGRLLGSLKDFSGVGLGGPAIRAALERVGLAPEAVQYVIVALQAGQGQIPSPRAAVRADIPMSVPSPTVDKVRVSGLDAIALADQQIRPGGFGIVVAGGMESMTNAPHVLPGSRSGTEDGPIEMPGVTARDGATGPFGQILMGALTDLHSAKAGIAREDQDAFSARSHRRAAAAIRNGVFAEEVVPVEVPRRKGDPVVAGTGQGVRADATAEGLAKLRPAFGADGTVTAGSACQICDGACAVVVMSKAKAEELGLEWLAEVGAHGNVAGPDNSLLSQPSHAIRHALGEENLPVGDLDLIEISEAFAAAGLHSTRELRLSDEDIEAKGDLSGGAIALGHPPGMSGARLVLTLALELRRRGGGVGAAALCGGGGQGSGPAVRVPEAVGV
jgi:acetyl-CoA C-acetyltransferase